MIASSAVLFYICIGLYFLFLVVLDKRFFSALKKEHKENRGKKEEEYHQMWIDFKPVYNTLESQRVFVRRLRPKTSSAGAAYSTSRPPS